jgi:hypothetical protein
MKKNRLLTNPNYSGLGRIRVQASITDPKAIEKFLDGRYMTFSAGSTTDKHVCSICMSDWAQGDICEHRHGRIYDNEICVFMTGSFKILEGSVVNTPADDLSQIISMEYYDSNNELQDLNVDAKMDPLSFYLSDSFFNLIKDSEVQMEQEKESTVEEVNVVEETVAEKTATDSAETTVEEEVVAEVAVDSETETETSEVEKQMSDAEESIVENIDADVDWYLLDCALSVELEDKTLSAEERKQLPESAFCGPNRSFPVNDCAHVTAARRLIERAKLSDAAKAKVLACVNKKAEAMKCDIEKDSSEVLTEEVKTLKAELADVKAELEKSLVEIKALVESFQADSTEEIKQADSLVEEVVEVATEDLKVIENPSAGSSDSSSPTEESLLDSLGAFEKKAVKQYSEILNKDGEAAANTFWEFKSQYLNKGFDPKKYIK